MQYELNKKKKKQLCPNTFPKTLDREQAEETPANLTPWHMQNPV
jgi:hypothetical protein